MHGELFILQRSICEAGLHSISVSFSACCGDCFTNTMTQSFPVPATVSPITFVHHWLSVSFYSTLFQIILCLKVPPVWNISMVSIFWHFSAWYNSWYSGSPTKQILKMRLCLGLNIIMTSLWVKQVEVIQFRNIYDDSN